MKSLGAFYNNSYCYELKKGDFVMFRVYHQEDEEEGFDIVEKNGQFYDIGIMLHGHCDLFVLELAQKLKDENIPFCYGIMVNEEGLVHAFLLLEAEEINSDEDIFIDVRGMTTDEEEFFSEFEDFFSWRHWEDSEYEYLDFMHTEKEFKETLEELCNESLKEYFNMMDERNNAKKIIEAFPEKYIYNK